MRLLGDDKGLSLFYQDRLLFRHSAEKPMLSLGHGEEEITMFRGNFHISDEVAQRIPLKFAKADQAEDGLNITFSDDSGRAVYLMAIRQQPGWLTITGHALIPGFNRLWLKMSARPGERIYGLGEQYSALNLRGRSYPIFTSEQGVGRNKKTLITFLADQAEGAGGDYWTSYFPQATFVSSELYCFYLEGYGYAEIDLRKLESHGIHVWNDRFSARICCDENYPALMERLTELLGRQPMMPRWAFEGVWLGMQGGSDRVNARLKRPLEAGLSISAVWTQDWVGQRNTSFGQRLQWDWRWNRERYPSLKEDISALKERGISWMAYINPYLVEGGVLFQQAQEKGYFVKRQDGSDYLVDFGEFNGGMVDLTHPEAFRWYKQVIAREMIALGFRGWMADFGEYLPVDCAVHAGVDGISAHNQWPTLWARLNQEAVEESGMQGQIAFFTRSGAAHTQRHSPMMFGGDQNVDWSEDDGLPSVINAALSLAMTGFGMFTFDIGGYTALFHLKRSKELLLRGCEFAAFTPVMRTHEGNRPAINHQFDSDEDTLAFFSRFSRIHSRLAAYLYQLALDNHRRGWPVMRPLFFHYPEDERAGTAMYEYLLGREILVAPVVEEGAQTRGLYLPQDGWIHLWSGQRFSAGEHTIAAPLGQPPVFFREGSGLRPLMNEILSVH